jgi:hypothetical protein
MEPDHLKDAIEKCRNIKGYPGLSFFGENGLTEDEIAKEANAPNGWMRVSTIGAMRKAGFSPWRVGANFHLTLRFPRRPSDRQLERLINLFDDPIENPHPLRVRHPSE